MERRAPSEGSLLDVELVSAASDYCPLNALRGAALTDALAQELDARIRAVGPEHVAARREPCLRPGVTQKPTFGVGDKNVAVLSEVASVGASDIVDDEGRGPQAVDCGGAILSKARMGQPAEVD